MISTLFNGAAYLTVTGYLAVSFYKEAVIDPAYQLMYKAEKVSIGAIASNFCISNIILALASDKAARKFLKDINEKPAALKDDSAEPNPSLTGDNVVDTSSPFPSQPPSSSPSSSHIIATEATTRGASPATCPAPYHTLPSPIEKRKRFSIDSDDTLVPDDDESVKDISDDALDTLDDSHSPSQPSKELIPVTEHQTTPDVSLPGPELEPPLDTTSDVSVPGLELEPPPLDTTPTASHILPPPPTHQRSRRGKLNSSIKQKYEPRASRLIAARDSVVRPRPERQANTIRRLEQEYDQIVVDHAAFVDDWVACMAKVGLSSMLTRNSPASLPRDLG
ncbi:hypothetical protein DFH29DRAFT_221315 [Suillus ampliporus]|nr:hypothetical protein DFH29DRAFT_221315 [Suillus ampliporus]